MIRSSRSIYPALLPPPTQGTTLLLRDSSPARFDQSLVIRVPTSGQRSGRRHRKQHAWVRRKSHCPCCDRDHCSRRESERRLIAQLPLLGGVLSFSNAETLRTDHSKDRTDFASGKYVADFTNTRGTPDFGAGPFLERDEWYEGSDVYRPMRLLTLGHLQAADRQATGYGEVSTQSPHGVSRQRRCSLSHPSSGQTGWGDPATFTTTRHDQYYL